MYVSSRNAGALEDASREMGAAGWYAADLAVAGEPEALVEACVDTLGGLDVLVANTGGPPPGEFSALPQERWDEAVELVLMSAVRLVRASLPHIRRSEAGRIVFITSVAVRQPIPRLVLSNSLRAAVTGFAKTLSGELAGDRVTVNCLAPDAIRTDALARLGDLEELERRTPMKRLGDPSEVGAVCAFLCSRQAGYVTGQTLGVDGGSLLGVH